MAKFKYYLKELEREQEQEQESVDFNYLKFVSPPRAPVRCQVNLFSPYEENNLRIMDIHENPNIPPIPPPTRPTSPERTPVSTSSLHFSSPLHLHGSSKTPTKRLLVTSLSPMRSPTSSAAKQINIGKKSRSRWTDDETKILIGIYKKWAPKLRKDKKKTTWEKIKKQYDCKCKQNDITSAKTSKQLSDRVDYLISKFKEMKDNNSRSGRGSKTFKWYKEMSELLSDRQSIIPTEISNSDDPPSTRNLAYENIVSYSDHPYATSDHINDENPHPNDEENSEESSDIDENIAPANNAPTSSKRMSKGTAFAELLHQIEKQAEEQSKRFDQQNTFLMESAREERNLMERFVQSNEASQASERALTEALIIFLNR